MSTNANVADQDIRTSQDSSVARICRATAMLHDSELEAVAGGYLVWEMKNVRVTSYSVSGATDGAGKVEYTWKIEEGVK